MAKNATITAEIGTTSDGSATHLVLKFDNGETLALAAGDLTPEIRSQALMHGLKQKLVDAAAISRNPDTGRSATTEDKYAAVREVYDRLLAGQWNKAREAGAGGGSGGLLFRALVRMGKAPEKARVFLEGKSPAELAALRKHPPIAAVIEEIRGEDAARKGGGDGPDVGALLGELGEL